MNSDPQSTPDPPSQDRFQGLRTGLLIAGSALLGGLAVVLWNRSSLARLRQPTETVQPPPVSADGEDE